MRIHGLPKRTVESTNFTVLTCDFKSNIDCQNTYGRIVQWNTVSHFLAKYIYLYVAFFLVRISLFQKLEDEFVQARW